jgi:hypothetical protein
MDIGGNLEQLVALHLGDDRVGDVAVLPVAGGHAGHLDHLDVRAAAGVLGREINRYPVLEAAS